MPKMILSDFFSVMSTGCGAAFFVLAGTVLRAWESHSTPRIRPAPKSLLTAGAAFFSALAAGLVRDDEI